MKSNQQGIGLIEVMIALLLLAVGVLGFVALQTNSLKATGESLERTQSLVLMRELAEKVRVNPTAIATYETAINGFDPEDPSKSAPKKDCLTQKCAPADLAQYDAYQISQQVSQYSFRLGIHHCPNTGGATASPDQATYSYCLITAWGDTKPTYGSDKKSDCLDPSDGSYYRDATCMFMELT